MPLEWYRRMAALGRLWPITPSRELTLVHAVQRPLVEPKILQLEARRDPGASFAYLHGEVRVHGASTEKLDLIASWDEAMDSPGPPDLQGSRPAQAHALEVPIHLGFDQRARPIDPSPDEVPAGAYDEEDDLVRFEAPAP